MEKFFDLSFSKQPDGSVRLVQDDRMDEAAIIDLHPAQLRHVCETFGLVAPNYPADELSKQLAEQLCLVFLEMSDDYRYLSHALEDSYSRIDGFIAAMPTAIFPFHLWDERDERKQKAKEKKQATSAQKPQPSATVEAGGQLGLEV